MIEKQGNDLRSPEANEDVLEIVYREITVVT